MMLEQVSRPGLAIEKRLNPRHATNGIHVLKLVLRSKLVLIICLLILTRLSSAATDDSPDGDNERPNIVVILCDDLGYGDLECYGHPHIKTPNLNRLAAEGIRCTDFYSAAPVCSPSRVGLLTGRSPNRAGVYDWIPPAGARPRPDAREQVHMRASEITIPALLKEAGYATCMSGKWHCNSRFNDAAQPQPGDFGFDHWFGTQNNAAPSHENPVNYVRNGQDAGPLNGYSCQLAVDEVLQWLDQRDAEQASPFFVYLAFHEPHEPVASPAPLVETYSKVSEGEDQAQYFANVANVDAAVGRLVEALDQRQLRENTLIIFTSDNGPETLRRYKGAERSWGRPDPLRGMKLHTHDAGFRVAGIMNWKGTFAGGQTISTPISSLDFLPTFCKLANASLPEGLSLDGTDFLPLLESSPPDREKPLVWCYFNATNEARVAMRHGRWKVLARLEGGTFPKMQNITTGRLESVQSARLTNFEIYDIEQDVAEANNLVNSDIPEIGELQKLLTTSYRELVENSHVWTTVKDE